MHVSAEKTLKVFWEKAKRQRKSSITVKIEIVLDSQEFESYTRGGGLTMSRSESIQKPARCQENESSLHLPSTQSPTFWFGHSCRTSTNQSAHQLNTK